MTSDHVSAAGLVEAVNVGEPRPVQVNGRTVWTAIWKSPVAGRVPLRGVNLLGDDQADRSVHGGPDKAVYAYSAEETELWEDELGVSLGPGAFGENLTVRGLPVSAAVIGERWAVGSALLEVAQPRLPCFKLGLRMGDPGFVKRFAVTGRPGAYLRVISEGDIGAGDTIAVLERPAHGVTSELVSRAILLEPELLEQALLAPELPADLREWMDGRAAAAAALRRVRAKGDS
ncbi:MAG TPA: MOSC domain-containing protein [Solirubrobacteraceae bacterium]|nr:MOSC domain-containing protein [Solirubrobacteraceae bacterium]